MDDYAFDPTIRRQLKQAIIDVLLNNNHQCDMADEASEMFVRLIELGLARLSRTEHLDRKGKPSAGAP
jgi:hypothetical protein